MRSYLVEAYYSKSSDLGKTVKDIERQLRRERQKKRKIIMQEKKRRKKNSLEENKKNPQEFKEQNRVVQEMHLKF